MTRAEPEPVARRVLVVSADIGGGHDATGQALAERVRALWPGSQVGWVDTLDVMGPGVGRSFRRTYVTNVGTTPWLYEFFWASLWRHRWFAAASKGFVGGWAGRRLARVVENFDPDLIVSTYPLGSAGLVWLRKHRGLGVPLGAWVSDFAPSPFWVYPELDLDVVVHPAALPLAAVAAPGARLGVCAPPVSGRFHPGDRDEAARRCGLDPDRRLVVVACGSYGFGAVEEAIEALTGIGGRVQVVAVCGRNDRLADRLDALGVPEGRLRVLRWVDDMPTLLRAADLLVTNAGGATALEAWATGVPVVMYRPIAAHGVANAALMTACGLAETARTPAALVACVRSRLGGTPPEPPRPVPRALPDLGLPALAASPPAAAPPARRTPPSWRLRPQDAFFLHVESGTVAQQVGVVLELGPRPDGRAVDRAGLQEMLARRLPAITTLRRRLVARGRWKRPGWVVDRYIDPAAHLAEVRVTPDDADGAGALDRFWSEPLSTDRPPWRMLLISGLPDGRARVAVKLHHCLGDGLSVVRTLQRLLDPPAAAGNNHPRPVGPSRQPLAARARDGLRRTALTARGLVRLAAAGPARAGALNRPLTTPHRRLVTAVLPTAEVLRAARSCQAQASEVMCALAAEALRRTYPHEPVPPRLRAMFPVSNHRLRAPTQGNWTGAVTLELPLEPGPVRARVATVRDSLRASLASGEPVAAGLVVRAMGALPAPLHAALARRVYTRRFINVIVSYVSALTRAQSLAGAPVRAAIPVVALADGVPIGVGMLRWGETIGIGVLLDESLADAGARFAAAMRAGLDELLREGERQPVPTGSGPDAPTPGRAG